MGKRFNGHWKYYKFTKGNKTIVRFTDSIRYFKHHGYSYEVLKPKRYSDKTFKKIVKEVLSTSDVPLGTTDFWYECLNRNLLLSRETFLKRLKKVDDDWLVSNTVGSSYTWSVRK